MKCSTIRSFSDPNICLFFLLRSVFMELLGRRVVKDPSSSENSLFSLQVPFSAVWKKKYEKNHVVNGAFIMIKSLAHLIRGARGGFLIKFFSIFWWLWEEMKNMVKNQEYFVMKESWKCLYIKLGQILCYMLPNILGGNIMKIVTCRFILQLYSLLFFRYVAFLILLLRIQANFWHLYQSCFCKME